MKKVLLIFVFGIIALGAFSQGKTLFLDNEPWKNVLKQAEKKDKLIFVDCYTSWCGPCKHLMNNVFPQKQVSDYLKSKFVCVKYDMEKEHGREFLTQYFKRKLYAYPTMLIIDSQGQLLHMIRGAREADDLLNYIDQGLSDKYLYEVEKEYQEGNRELSLVKRYLWFLTSMGNDSTYQKVASDYAASFPIDSLLNQDIWSMVERFIWENPYSQEYRFIVEHLEKFAQIEKNYYELECALYITMRLEVNKVNSKIFKTENPDSLLILKQKVDQLLELTKYPVKEFPIISAELRVVEAMLDNDVDKVYERFITFEDCNFLIDVLWYRRSVFQYLLAHLVDKQRVQICMDRLLVYQNRVNPEYKKSLGELMALGKEKLANMERWSEFLIK